MENFACILDPLIVLDDDDIDEMAYVTQAAQPTVNHLRVQMSGFQRFVPDCASVFNIGRAVINDTYYLFSDEEADALGWPYSHMCVGRRILVFDVILT